MKTKKITIFLFLTVISLLTMFLVVLLDDTVLATADSKSLMLPNLNLSEMSPGVMVATIVPESGVRFLQDELKPMKAV